MPVLLQEGRLLHARRACSQIQKGPFFCLNTHALHSCGAKQIYIKIKYSSPSHAFHSPTHFPSSPNPHPSHPPSHSPSVLSPHTFCPPSHSPSVCSPLSFRPQPTPRPSAARSLSVPSPLSPSPLLPELVHLLPCLLLQATYSPVPSFSCPLATFPCLFSHTTCSLVSPSTRQLTMLLLELVHLLPCLLIHLTCSLVSSLTRLLPPSPVFSCIQLVPSSPRQHVNLPVTHRTCSSVTLSPLATNLFPCLLVNSSTYNVTLRTCSPVTMSINTANLFPCPLVNPSSCKLFLSSYFFVGTCPKHCNANSSLFVTQF